jgi:hypothetical protein
MIDKQIPRTLKGFKLNQVLIAIILAMMFPACSERSPEPLVMPDSTIVYPAKDSNDITAVITFSRFLGQKTGRQWGLTSVFPIQEDEYVYAVVDLENRLKNADRELMFHIDWIGPDGKSFYMKRADLPAGDTASALESSVSVSPGKRIPGKHLLRIYLFRELIAEKVFELRDDSEVEKVSANIIFFKSTDKETGELKGIDTSFAIRKKGILRVRVELSNPHIYKDEELPFRLEWYGPDGEPFYSKKSEIRPSDALSVINGSISITPDKRLPGEYMLKIYLFDDIVAEKIFELTQAD